jgi:hypothetical protein
MPGPRNNALNNLKMYEELRDDGASKEKAARISNAAADDPGFRCSGLWARPPPTATERARSI